MNFSEPVEAGAMSLPCSLMLLNDQNLVVRAKAGNTAAFVELGGRHSTKVQRKVYRITRNWEDAGSCFPGISTKGVQTSEWLRKRKQIQLLLVAYQEPINSALMTLRKRKASKEVSIDIVGGDYEIFGSLEPQDLSEDPEQRYARREREELLKRAMLQLSPGLRDAIQLRQAEECSLQELAERLGISVSAAKSRLFRARVALQACLQ